MSGPEDWLYVVEIELSQPPADADLEALGLNCEGSLVWGRLSRSRIEALAQVPQVLAIRLSDRPAPASSAPAEAVIGAPLQMELLDANRATFHVGVVFRAPVRSASDFPSLSVHLDTGSGMLTREQVYELARREDVVKIDLIPPSKLL